MKKRKNGFTLIELLAVIVILAIIAVIAMPIIVGIIEDSRKAAFERSVEGIIHATDIDFGTQEVLSNEPYTISNGVLNKTLKTPIKNIDGFNGTIKYDEKGNSTYAIYNEKWCMKKTSEEITTTEYVEGECTLGESGGTGGVGQTIEKKNGQPIYFDVVNGVRCKKETYDLSFDETINDYRNSLTGYNGIDGTDNQNSCLKFYAYDYEEGDTEVKLLLDHNTTASTYWTDSSTSSNANGPITVLSELKTATDSWAGTKTPENYTVTQEGYGNYTIDYSDYKARLITAGEIAQITGNTSFDESTTSYDNWFFFDSNSHTRKDTCKRGDTSGCEYGWLYDRTHTSCTTYGCLNNADSGMTGYGYWTSTSVSSGAWHVNQVARLNNSSVDYGSDFGVRPVITVSKSNL